MSENRRIVFITGANTGLGLEIVKALYSSPHSYDIIVGRRLVSNGEAAVASVVQIALYIGSVIHASETSNDNGSHIKY